jgi:type IV secretion system pilin
MHTTTLVLSALADLPLTRLNAGFHSSASHATTTVASVLAASPPMAVKTLPEVIDALRLWVMGILAALATLFLVIGGLRYVTANGDPAAVEQAKGSIKAALIGYALAVLAPVILQVLQGILGA